MSVQGLQTLSLLAYVFAAVFFLLAVFLFFFWKVPALWGEVSGRTARKAIRAMKWKGEDASAQAAMHTQTAVPSKNTPLRAAEHKLPADAAQEHDSCGQTEVLPSSGQTEPLSQSVVSPSGTGETAVLHAAACSGFVARPEETLLSAQEQAHGADPSVLFVLEKELAFTDSTEIIE